MHSLYTISSSVLKGQNVVDKSGNLSIRYHDIFDYPLTFAELIKWDCRENIKLKSQNLVSCKNGYYFIQGKEGIVYKRTLRARTSAKKLQIAVKASKALSWIPAIKLVAVTGSLAMENATEDSDIDLLIITGKSSLWTTRIISYLLLRALNFDLRKANDKNQKDRICLNMWLDESSLRWSKTDRNLYTAHEIAQIVPLVNRGNTYEQFILQNQWILNYWPNSVRIPEKEKIQRKNAFFLTQVINWLLFKAQYFYMNKKITREIVTPSKAIFHPQDWGKVVLGRLGT